MLDGGGRGRDGVEPRQLRLRRLQPLPRRAFEVRALAEAGELGADVIEEVLDQVRRKFPRSAAKAFTCSRIQAAEGSA